MQNPIQKFKQNSIVFNKPGILPENLKTTLQLQLHYSLIFFAETSRKFPTYKCLQKGVWNFFLFGLDLELFAKIKKT